MTHFRGELEIDPETYFFTDWDTRMHEAQADDQL